MIASVRGRVLERGLNRVVIETGSGIGMEILATPETLASIHEGEETSLQTQLIVREDAFTLYGFANSSERAVFNALISVSRIGPKLALAALGALGADGIRRAVQEKDQAALTRIPGVGAKSAQRLLVEIGDRLGPAMAVSTDKQATGSDATVIAALVQLGWNEAQAQEAVGAITPGQPTAAALRAALAWLGGRNA